MTQRDRCVVALTAFLFWAEAATAQVEIDLSFGLSGVVTTDFGGAYDELDGLAIQEDGRILAVGTGGSSNRMAVARYLPSGLLDSSFSGDGTMIVPFSAGSPAVQARPGGKVLIGAPDLRSVRSFRAMQFEADGQSDSSFGVSGTGSIAVESQVYIQDMVVQPDGRILIGGYDVFNGNWDFVLTRFEADGAPDLTFGSGGLLTTDFSRPGIDTPEDFLQALAVQPDGKILAGGHSYTTGDSVGYYVHALARYEPDGTLDASFADGGKSVLRLTSNSFGFEEISDLEVLPDGKILAASTSRSETALLRFLPNGTLDPTFGSGGRIIAPAGAAWENPTQMLLDGRGGVLLASDDTFSVTRLTLDGQVDTAFGQGGTFDIDLGDPWRERVTSLGLQPDGKLLVGGYTTTQPNVQSEWRIARLTIGPPGPTGSLALTPTFDVKYVSSETMLVEDGATGLLVGLGFNQDFPEEQALLEFPIDAIPADATIDSVQLVLDPYVSSGAPRLEVTGYLGDGLASISDGQVGGEVVGTTEAVSVSSGEIVVELSTSFLQGLVGNASHLGIRLRSLDLPLYVGFSSTESFNSSNHPRLMVNYSLPLSLAGDFNDDGVVDAADYTVWRDSEGAAGVGLAADADGDGVVGQGDYDLWRANYGQTLDARAAARVPEPAAATALAVCLAAALAARRSRGTGTTSRPV